MRKLKGLYAITRESRGNTARLVEEVGAALQGGLRILQYRNKSGNQMLRGQEAGELRKLCSEYSALLIINDDPELAANTGADGVHLGKYDSSVDKARAQLGADIIIGISCYNQLSFAKNAEQQGADYVAFGSFFPSPTKPAAVTAEIPLLEAWNNYPTPACAIGGITLKRAPALIAAGADMLAIISDLWEADDIQKHARSYTQLWSG